jgi:peroxiredoxin/HAMP domain-containing protein
MKKKLIYVFAIVLLASCSGKQGFKISGKLKGGKDLMAYLSRYEGNVPKVIDSCKIKSDDSFELYFTKKSPDFYSLSVATKQNNYMVLLLDSSDNNMTINARYDSLLSSYRVSGSPKNEMLKEYYTKSGEYYKKREELRNKLSSFDIHDTINRNQVLAEVNEVKKSFNTYRNAFVDANQASAAALVALADFDMNIEEDLEYIKKIEAAIRLTMPNSQYHKSLLAQLQQAEQNKQMLALQKAEEERLAQILKPGTPAPEIKLNDPDGKPIALSSLRGKIVLIDFWASWCRPCRAENPNVVKVYNQYKSKGFEIYSVSLDNNRDNWVNAIREDGLVWKSHVSDLQMWNSSVVSQYSISGIPFTVLIDRKGNIIQTNLRGQALEEKLKELFAS